MPVRAKFRCLHLTESWDKSHQAELAPVYDDGDEENKSFWKATPSGHAELQIGPECMFSAGSYYYIDLSHAGELPKTDSLEFARLYRLERLIDHGGNIEVALRSGYSWDDNIRRGELKMTIDNSNAYGLFVGRVGTHYKVTYTEAQNSP